MQSFWQSLVSLIVSFWRRTWNEPTRNGIVIFKSGSVALWFWVNTMPRRPSPSAKYRNLGQNTSKRCRQHSGLHCWGIFGNFWKSVMEESGGEKCQRLARDLCLRLLFWDELYFVFFFVIGLGWDLRKTGSLQTSISTKWVYVCVLERLEGLIFHLCHNNTSLEGFVYRKKSLSFLMFVNALIFYSYE